MNSFWREGARILSVFTALAFALHVILAGVDLNSI